MRHVPRSSLSGRFLAALVLIFCLSACRQSQQTPSAPRTINVSIEASPPTPVVGEAELHVKLIDQEGKPITGTTVEIRGDMTHAGMEPVFASADSGTDGIYAAPFEWTMAGDWIVTVTVTQPNMGTVTETFNFTVTNP